MTQRGRLDICVFDDVSAIRSKSYQPFSLARSRFVWALTQIVLGVFRCGNKTGQIDKRLNKGTFRSACQLCPPVTISRVEGFDSILLISSAGCPLFKRSAHHCDITSHTGLHDSVCNSE